MLKKLTALTLLLTYSLSQSANAEEIRAALSVRPALEFVQPFQPDLALPPAIGTVVKLRGENPHLILMADPHGEYSGQINIQRILEFLNAKAGIRHLFLEGAQGPLDPSRLEFFKELQWNLKSAGVLAREAEIGGAELFLLSSEGRKVEASGIENKELYLKDLDAFQRVYGASAEIKDFIARRSGEIEKRARAVLKTGALELFLEWMNYERSGDLLRYLNYLQRSLKSVLSVDIADPLNQLDFPMLVRYAELKSREALMKPDKAERDFARLSQWCSKSKLETSFCKALENTGEIQNRRAFWENFYEAASPKGFKFEEYPDLSLSEGAKILESEISSEDLQREIEDVRGKLFQKWNTDRKAGEMIQEFQNFLLLKNLFELKLSREDWERISKMKIAEVSGPVRGAYQSAVEFYRLAAARESFMAKAFAERDHSGLDVVIAGGFHVPGIEKILEAKGIDYAVVHPHMPQIEGLEKYTAAMTGQKPGLDLSGQNMRVMSWTADWSSADLPPAVAARRSEIRSAILNWGITNGAHPAELIGVGNSPARSELRQKSDFEKRVERIISQGESISKETVDAESKWLFQFLLPEKHASEPEAQYVEEYFNFVDKLLKSSQAHMRAAATKQELYDKITNGSLGYANTRDFLLDYAGMVNWMIKSDRYRSKDSPGNPQRNLSLAEMRAVFKKSFRGRISKNEFLSEHWLHAGTDAEVVAAAEEIPFYPYPLLVAREAGLDADINRSRWGKYILSLENPLKRVRYLKPAALGMPPALLLEFEKPVANDRSRFVPAFVLKEKIPRFIEPIEDGPEYLARHFEFNEENLRDLLLDRTADLETQVELKSRLYELVAQDRLLMQDDYILMSDSGIERYAEFMAEETDEAEAVLFAYSRLLKVLEKLKPGWSFREPLPFEEMERGLQQWRSIKLREIEALKSEAEGKQAARNILQGFGIANPVPLDFEFLAELEKKKIIELAADGPVFKLLIASAFQRKTDGTPLIPRDVLMNFYDAHLKGKLVRSLKEAGFKQAYDAAVEGIPDQLKSIFDLETARAVTALATGSKLFKNDHIDSFHQALMKAARALAPPDALDPAMSPTALSARKAESENIRAAIARQHETFIAKLQSDDAAANIEGLEQDIAAIETQSESLKEIPYLVDPTALPQIDLANLPDSFAKLAAFLSSYRAESETQINPAPRMREIVKLLKLLQAEEYESFFTRAKAALDAASDEERSAIERIAAKAEADFVEYKLIEIETPLAAKDFNSALAIIDQAREFLFHPDTRLEAKRAAIAADLAIKETGFLPEWITEADRLKNFQLAKTDGPIRKFLEAVSARNKANAQTQLDKLLPHWQPGGPGRKKLPDFKEIEPIYAFALKVNASFTRSELRGRLSVEDLEALSGLGFNEVVLSELASYTKQTANYRPFWARLVEKGKVSPESRDGLLAEAERLIEEAQYAHAQSLLKKADRIEKLSLELGRAELTPKAANRLAVLKAVLKAKSSAEIKIQGEDLKSQSNRVREKLREQFKSGRPDSPEWGMIHSKIITDNAGRFVVKFEHPSFKDAKVIFDLGRREAIEAEFSAEFDTDLLYYLFRFSYPDGKGGTEVRYYSLRRDEMNETVISANSAELFSDSSLARIGSSWSNIAAPRIAAQIDRENINEAGLPDFQAFARTNSSGNITFKSKLPVLFNLDFPPLTLTAAARIWSSKLNTYVFSFMPVTVSGQPVLNEQNKPRVRSFILDKREKRITPIAIETQGVMQSRLPVPDEAGVRRLMFEHALHPSPFDDDAVKPFDGLFVRSNSIGDKNYLMDRGGQIGAEEKPRSGARLHNRITINLGKPNSTFRIRRFYSKAQGDWIYETVQVNDQGQRITQTTKQFRLRRKTGVVDLDNIFEPLPRGTLSNPTVAAKASVESPAAPLESISEITGRAMKLIGEIWAISQSGGEAVAGGLDKTSALAELDRLLKAAEEQFNAAEIAPYERGEYFFARAFAFQLHGNIPAAVETAVNGLVAYETQPNPEREIQIEEWILSLDPENAFVYARMDGRKQGRLRELLDLYSGAGPDAGGIYEPEILSLDPDNFLVRKNFSVRAIDHELKQLEMNSSWLRELGIRQFEDIYRNISIRIQRLRDFGDVSIQKILRERLVRIAIAKLTSDLDIEEMSMNEREYTARAEWIIRKIDLEFPPRENGRVNSTLKAEVVATRATFKAAAELAAEQASVKQPAQARIAAAVPKIVVHGPLDLAAEREEASGILRSWQKPSGKAARQFVHAAHSFLQALSTGASAEEVYRLAQRLQQTALDIARINPSEGVKVLSGKVLPLAGKVKSKIEQSSRSELRAEIDRSKVRALIYGNVLPPEKLTAAGYEAENIMTVSSSAEAAAAIKNNIHLLILPNVLTKKEGRDWSAAMESLTRDKKPALVLIITPLKEEAVLLSKQFPSAFRIHRKTMPFAEDFKAELSGPENLIAERFFAPVNVANTFAELEALILRHVTGPDADNHTIVLVTDAAPTRTEVSSYPVSTYVEQRSFSKWLNNDVLDRIKRDLNAPYIWKITGSDRNVLRIESVNNGNGSPVSEEENRAEKTAAEEAQQAQALSQALAALRESFILAARATALAEASDALNRAKAQFGIVPPEQAGEFNVLFRDAEANVERLEEGKKIEEYKSRISHLLEAAVTASTSQEVKDRIELAVNLIEKIPEDQREAFRDSLASARDRLHHLRGQEIHKRELEPIRILLTQAAAAKDLAVARALIEEARKQAAAVTDAEKPEFDGLFESAERQAENLWSNEKKENRKLHTAAMGFLREALNETSAAAVNKKIAAAVEVANRIPPDRRGILPAEIAEARTYAASLAKPQDRVRELSMIRLLLKQAALQGDLNAAYTQIETAEDHWSVIGGNEREEFDALLEAAKKRLSNLEQQTAEKIERLADLSLWESPDLPQEMGIILTPGLFKVLNDGESVFSFKREEKGKHLILKRDVSKNDKKIPLIRVYEQTGDENAFLFSFVLGPGGFVRSDKPFSADENYSFIHPLFPLEPFYVSKMKGFDREAPANRFFIHVDENDEVVQIDHGVKDNLVFHSLYRDYRKERRIGFLILRSEGFYLPASMRAVIEGVKLVAGTGLTKRDRRITSANVWVGGREFQAAPGAYSGVYADVRVDRNFLIDLKIGSRMFRQRLKRNEKNEIVETARVVFDEPIAGFTGSLLRLPIGKKDKVVLPSPLTSANVRGAKTGDLAGAALVNGVVVRTDVWKNGTGPESVYRFIREPLAGQLFTGNPEEDKKIPFRYRVQLLDPNFADQVNTQLFVILNDFHYKPLKSFARQISYGLKDYSGIITGLERKSRGRIILGDKEYVLPSAIDAKRIEAYVFNDEKITMFVAYGKGRSLAGVTLFDQDGRMKSKTSDLEKLEMKLKKKYDYNLDLSAYWKEMKDSEKAFKKGLKGLQSGGPRMRQAFKNVSPISPYYERARLYSGGLLERLGMTKAQVLEELASEEMNWSLNAFYIKHALDLPMRKHLGLTLFIYGLGIGEEYRVEALRRIQENLGRVGPAAQSLDTDKASLEKFLATAGVNLERIEKSEGALLSALVKKRAASEAPVSADQVHNSELEKIKSKNGSASWNLPAFRKSIVEELGLPSTTSYADILWGLSLTDAFLEEYGKRVLFYDNVPTHINRSFGFGERESHMAKSIVDDIEVLSGKKYQAPEAGKLSIGLTPEEVIQELKGLNWDLQAFVKKHPDELSWRLSSGGYAKIFKDLGLESQISEKLKTVYINFNGIKEPAAAYFNINQDSLKLLMNSFVPDWKNLPMPDGNMLAAFFPDKTFNEAKDEVLNRLKASDWNLAQLKEELLRRVPSIPTKSGRVTPGRFILALGIKEEFLRIYEERKASDEYHGAAQLIGQSFGWVKSPNSTLGTVLEELNRNQTAPTSEPEEARSRSELRIEVASDLTHKIFETAFALELVPRAFASDEEIHASDFDYASEYASMMKRGIKIVLPAEIFMNVSPRVRSRFMDEVMKGVELASIKDTEPVFYFAGPKQSDWKAEAFKSGHLQKFPAGAKLFRFSPMSEIDTANSLAKEAVALSTADRNPENSPAEAIPAFLIRAEEIDKLPEADALKYLHNLTLLQMLAAAEFKGALGAAANRKNIPGLLGQLLRNLSIGYTSRGAFLEPSTESLVFERVAEYIRSSAAYAKSA